MQYDTIYHEHLRYYSFTSLNFILTKHKLKIFDYEMISTHGGSIRVYCCHKSNKNYVVDKKKINKIYHQEKKFFNISNFKKYKNKIENSKKDIINLLIKLKNKKKTVFGVGAPSRASTLISYCSLKSSSIKSILEIPGSYKIGRYMPGTDIKVISEEKGLSKNPDYLLLLSWHISKELIDSIKKKRL